MSVLPSSRQDIQIHPEPERQATQTIPAQSMASLASIPGESPNNRALLPNPNPNGPPPGLNRLIAMRNARLAGPRKSDEQVIEGRIRHYLDEFVTLNFVLLLVFGLFLIMTQAFEVSWIGALIGVQVMVGLKVLLLLKNHCTLQTTAEKRANGYKILESILFVIFLFTIQQYISDSSSTAPAIALTVLFLLIQFLEAGYIFHITDKSRWAFDKYLNGMIFLVKLCLIFQVVLALVRSMTDFGPWAAVFIPLYFMAGLLLLHFAYAMILILSKTGRTLWTPMTKGKCVGLVFTLIMPVLFAVILAWSAKYLAGVLDDNSTKYDIEDRPLLLLFIVVICLSIFAVFYVYCCESAIILTSKYIACIMDISTRNKARVEKLIKKLQDDYANSLEDKFIPEILLKVSNVYYKLVQNNSPSKTKISPVGTKDMGKDLENPEVGAQEQKEEEKPKESLADLDQNEEKNENAKCVICFDGKQDAVYLPCGHGGVCYECAQEMIKTKGDCHLCRKPIRRLIKVDTEDAEGVDNKLVKVVSVTIATKTAV